MVKREVNYGIYLIALVMSIIIFTTGLLVGNALNESKQESISKDLAYLDEARNLQETNMLLLDALEEKRCELLSGYIEMIIPELETFGERVNRYESSSDSKRFGEEEYRALKNKYMLLLIKYWTLIKSYEKDCKSPIDDIIYFYSNEKCDDCTSQGIILDSIKKNNPDIMIFSLEGDSNLSSVKILAKTYNVTEYPYIVINGAPYKGLLSKTQIEKVLKK